MDADDDEKQVCTVMFIMFLYHACEQTEYVTFSHHNYHEEQWELDEEVEVVNAEQTEECMHVVLVLHMDSTFGDMIQCYMHVSLHEGATVCST